MEKNKIKLSVVIPCYNEEKNIHIILEKFNDIISTDDIEVILVDNGSTDNSLQLLKTLIPNYHFAKLVIVEVNQGYGFGITSGLNSAEGEFIGYTHADLQTDPFDVLKAFDLILKSKQPKDTYVKGDRKNRPFFDQLFTTGMSIFESFYLGTKLWDINAQPNIFHRSFFENLKNIPKDFSLDLYLLFMSSKRQINLVRFDVFFPPRLHGNSSWNNGFSSKWKFIKRTINFSFKLKKYI